MVTLDQMKVKYSEPDWRITESEEIVQFTKMLPGVCQVHKETVHLGVNETGEYLAIYYGPSVDRKSVV